LSTAKTTRLPPPRKQVSVSKVLDVHIGQVKVAKNGETLKAILGSCVGIGILWKEKKICGLAHCLLPASPVPTFEIGARFVDQALRSLMALMKIKATDVGAVELIIVGGGNMTNPEASEDHELVGTSNFKVAIAEAKKNHLRIIHSEGGGETGRKIIIDGSDFTYRIEKIPRIIDAA